jgi:hypothetical protein
LDEYWLARADGGTCGEAAGDCGGTSEEVSEICCAPAGVATRPWLCENEFGYLIRAV